MDENQTIETLTSVREQVRPTIESLDEIRIHLEATVAGLRLPENGEDIDGPLAGLYEVDAVIRCGLHDHLKPLIASLRKLV